MLGRILIFTAGAVIGALGASYLAGVNQGYDEALENMAKKDGDILKHKQQDEQKVTPTSDTEAMA